jgi:hypothetical protein
MKQQTKTVTMKEVTLAPPKSIIARNDAKGATASAAIDSNSRHQMIEIAAYHRAELRGFQGGSELEDWLTAEAQVDAQLMQ